MPKPKSFSQRKGLKPVQTTIQTDNMDSDLRVGLWNALDIGLWRESNIADRYSRRNIYDLGKAVWWRVLGQPLDLCPDLPEGILREIRKHFFKCQWFEVYDLLEVILSFRDDEKLTGLVNAVLEQELSGYRFIHGVFSDITSEQELEMLNDVLADEHFPGVRKHLQRALELLSDRKNPDYRNSIKESISAVESIARAITGSPKATLGDALGRAEISGRIHPALKEAFAKLYGYTSDEQGIRHAMEDEPNLSAADARYFLLSCTSFINYLKAKTSSGKA